MVPFVVKGLLLFYVGFELHIAYTNDRIYLYKAGDLVQVVLLDEKGEDHVSNQLHPIS